MPCGRSPGSATGLRNACRTVARATSRHRAPGPHIAGSSAGIRLHRLGPPGQERLDALFKHTSRQEDAPAAGEAADADIGAEAVHPPVIAATGVRFPETDGVAQAYLHYHGSSPS